MHGRMALSNRRALALRSVCASVQVDHQAVDHPTVAHRVDSFHRGTGVSVVIAIDLAGQAAAGSFHSSDRVTQRESRPYHHGHWRRERDAAGKVGGASISTALVTSDRRLRNSERPRRGVAVHRTRPGRSSPDGGWFVRCRFHLPKPIWVGAKLGWKKGSTVKLLINDRLQEFTVAGALPGSSAGHR